VDDLLVGGLAGPALLHVHRAQRALVAEGDPRGGLGAGGAGVRRRAPAAARAGAGVRRRAPAAARAGAAGRLLARPVAGLLRLGGGLARGLPAERGLGGPAARRLQGGALVAAGLRPRAGAA